MTFLSLLFSFKQFDDTLYFSDQDYNYYVILVIVHRNGNYSTTINPFYVRYFINYLYCKLVLFVSYNDKAQDTFWCREVLTRIDLKAMIVEKFSREPKVPVRLWSFRNRWMSSSRTESVIYSGMLCGGRERVICPWPWILLAEARFSVGDRYTDMSRHKKRERVWWRGRNVNSREPPKLVLEKLSGITLVQGGGDFSGKHVHFLPGPWDRPMHKKQGN